MGYELHDVEILKSEWHLHCHCRKETA